jgi:serine/threonine protein kinase/Tol biopolymer transport system component
VSLAVGSRVGPYEVLSVLGAGGMGEVFRARDTRLNRDVALKTLPIAFAGDAERLARFDREARVLASLNHPHIGAIYGIENDALVLELVEGPTLADAMARGAIALDDALPIARQIADALAAAHELGVVHRDLKPGNVKIRPDGTVKVLDFGLAKIADDAARAMSAGVNDTPTQHLHLSQSPTITSPALMTSTGVILGTASYMSPEQARGRAVDRRADLWAFGCVLFEMLAGTRAFPGEDVSETLATVIKGEPDWRTLPASTPTSIRRLLRRCLTKDPKARLSDASVARMEIDEALSSPDVDRTQATSRRERVAFMSALAVVTLVAVAALFWALSRPLPIESEMRLEITTPPTTDPVSMALSPDGQKLAFVANVDGRPRLWVRSLDSVAARPLAGTDGARWPFWSPDSLSIGFFAGTQLDRIDVDGGLVKQLASILSGGGGAWGVDGTILFNPNNGVEPIWRTTAAGANPVRVTTREAPRQAAHHSPSLLPDGRHFLYYVAGAADVSGIYLGATDGTPSRRLFDADSAAVYHPAGYLLFVKQGTLFAQRFESSELTVSDNPVPVADNIAFLNSYAAVAVGGNRIAYRTGSGGGVRHQLAWFDRAGKEIGTVGPAETNGNYPSVSSTGERVVLQRVADIWLLERNLLTRLVSSPALDVMPLWSPDATRIVFTSARQGVADIYVKSMSGTASEDVLLASPLPKIPVDWSPDGRFLLYGEQQPKAGYDLLALPMEGNKVPIPIARTEFDERNGQFSPDGKWVAYQSNATGRDEIYVQSFPDPAITKRVTADGGGQVRWRRDGRELFYLGLDDKLMSVPVSFDARDRNIDFGTPRPLFLAPLPNQAAPVGITRQQYSVSPDGQRFLINKVVEEVVTTPITIILNWKPERHK